MSPQERGAHTPGPWQVAERYNCVDVRAVEGPFVADCNASFAIDWKTKEANARLIAAAPDYHEEVGRILAEHDEEAQACNFSRCGCPVCKSLRPIHAKAAGTQP